MNGILQTVEVAAAKPYRVEIGRNVLASSGTAIRAVTKAKRLAVITDTTVEALYAPVVCDSLSAAGFQVCKFAFAPGEMSKNLETIGKILDFLPENGKIRMPFNSLPGLGDTAAAKIIEAREQFDIYSIEELRLHTGISKAVIEILRRNHVLDGLSETNQFSMF